MRKSTLVFLPILNTPQDFSNLFSTFHPYFLTCLPVSLSCSSQKYTTPYSLVAIVTNSGLHYWEAMVELPAWQRDFSLLKNVQTGPGAHPASYSMGIGSLFLRGKAAGNAKLITRFNTESNNAWSYNIQSPIHLYDPLRGKFIFYK
jgi:hypothetical protein